MKYPRLTFAAVLALLLVLAGTAHALTATEVLADPANTPIASEFSPADEQGRYVYLIEFAEPGMLARHRQLRREGERFNADSPAMRSAQAELQVLQQQHIQNMAGAVGRALDVTHHYLVSHSGIATRLTPAEASAVQRLPGVVAVQRERVYQLDTFRGPEFIGAGAIWDGSAVPGNSELLGEEMVAAILDTGILVNHPSFANDTVHCAHGVGGVPDKLLSALDCATTDGTGMCNGPSPGDTHSHGSHVSGTVAGNFLDETSSPPPTVDISGVAPCAHVRSYKVCPTSCPAAQIQAGMDSVLLHGDVDVMNFSISGGTSPWVDNDRKKLDLVDAGILVAASAGNTSASIPDPVGNVGHRGPWVTTVANSSHDGLLANPLSVNNGPQNVAALQGTGPSLGSDFTGPLRWAGDADPGNEEGCTAFPGGAFSGEAALIIRGTCPFADKVNNAVAAGATFVVMINHLPGAPIVMGGLEGTSVSSVMVGNSDGLDIIAALDGGTEPVTVIAELEQYIVPALGDILSAGSLIGPTPSPLHNLQKPDITAPGTNIYAAGTPASGYTFMSGTSMSSPHVAGAAVLVKQAQPDWSPVEIKSALQMTASKSGLKANATTPWDADDVGSGRVDLTRAALAGLVMHETFQNFLDANPAIGGDVRTLNLPALRDMDCSPGCSFERTVRNTLSVPTSWSVSHDFFTGDFDVEVSPSSFDFTGDLNETQTLSITISPNNDQSAAIHFGELVFTEADSESPELHWTLAMSGKEALPPEAVLDASSFDFLLEEDGTNSTTLNIANVGDADLIYTIEQAEPFSVELRSIKEQRSEGPTEPINLVIDDGIATLVGVANQNYLWFNQFTPGPLDLPFTLEEVQVGWAPGNSGVQVGDIFDVYIWGDADRDPATGATLLGSVTGNEVTAGVNFKSVSIPGGIPIDESTGDVLIGVVNRTTANPYSPSVADSPGNSQGRSWIAFGFPGGSAGDPPVFSEAGTFGLIDDFLAGRNWTIRGFGTGGSACLNPSNVSWLDVTPDAGAISGGTSENILVEVDMDGLGLGVFEARLCIETNDPQLPVAIVPVRVEVVSEIELPEADITPSSFSFTVDPTSTDADDLIIANNGAAQLEWDLFEPFDFPILPSGDGAVVVLSENFSDTTFPPAGWSRHKLQGAGTQIWQRVTTQYSSAPASAHRRWSDGGDGFQDEWLVSPPLALQLEPALSFIDAGQWMVDYGYSGVWASTGSCDPADGEFVEIAEIDDTPGQTGTVTWRSAPVVLDLEAFSNETVCLAFRYSGTFAHSWWIDDVVVTTMPLDCYDPAEVDWLTVSASGGAVDSMDSETVTVTADGSGLQPGEYETVLCVYTNDPDNSLVTVPVLMEVTPSASTGTLEGTVNSLGYCGTNPAAGSGAEIEVVGEFGTFNTIADGDGFYSLFIDESESPLNVSVSLAGHLDDSESGVVVVAGETTVVDFDLVLEAACATVNPEDFAVSVSEGGTTSAALEIGNVNGGAQLDWTIDTAEVQGRNWRAHFPASPYIAEPGSRDGISWLADQAAGHGGGVSGAVLPMGMGVPAYSTTGFTADGYITMDALVPGDLTVINATQPTTFFAGAFIDNDLSQHYVLASDGGANPFNSFGPIDTATGTFTSQGLVTGAGSGTWTSMSWDHSTQTLFAVQVPGGGTNNLYTIDPVTLEATLIGNISGGGVDPGAIVIAIAVSPDGLMYAIDIIGDVLIAVDKTDAEAAVIGPLGVNANFAQDMDFDPTDGTLYWAGYLGGGNSQIYVVNTSTGAVNSLGNVENGNELLNFSIALPAATSCAEMSTIPWLSVNPEFGSTAAGSSDLVDVTFDATGLAPGTYAADLCVTTTDAQNGLIVVPVELEVLETQAADVFLQDLVQTYSGDPLEVTVVTDPPGLAVEVTYDGSTVAPTDAGSYAVEATVTEPGWTGSADDTFVIEPAAASILFDDLQQFYTGGPLEPTITTDPAGLNVIVTYDGSPTPPSAVGQYLVEVEIDEQNWTGSDSATFEILEPLPDAMFHDRFEAQD